MSTMDFNPMIRLCYGSYVTCTVDLEMIWVGLTELHELFMIGSRGQRQGMSEIWVWDRFGMRRIDHRWLGQWKRLCGRECKWSLGATPGWQPERKWEPQSYNLKPLSSASNQFRGDPSLLMRVCQLTPWFQRCDSLRKRTQSFSVWTSDPQNCKMLNACHFKLLNVW